MTLKRNIHKSKKEKEPFVSLASIPIIILLLLFMFVFLTNTTRENYRDRMNKGQVPSQIISSSIYLYGDKRIELTRIQKVGTGIGSHVTDTICALKINTDRPFTATLLVPSRHLKPVTNNYSKSNTIYLGDCNIHIKATILFSNNTLSEFKIRDFFIR